MTEMSRCWGSRSPRSSNTFKSVRLGTHDDTQHLWSQTRHWKCALQNDSSAYKACIWDRRRGGYKQVGERKEMLPTWEGSISNPTSLTQANQIPKSAAGWARCLKAIGWFHRGPTATVCCAGDSPSDTAKIFNRRAQSEPYATQRGSLKCRCLPTQAAFHTSKGQNQDTRDCIGKALCIPVHIRPVTISFLDLIYIFIWIETQ